jgi:hypothetical protein
LDPNVSAKDRIEAERLKLEASIAITKLEVEGTTITQVNQTMDMKTKIRLTVLT